MNNILKEVSIEDLHKLRDHINNCDSYSKPIKQELNDEIASEIRFRNLEGMMLPIVKEFIEERKPK